MFNRRKRSSLIIGVFQFGDKPPKFALYDSLSLFTERVEEEIAIHKHDTLKYAHYRSLHGRLKKWKVLPMN